MPSILLDSIQNISTSAIPETYVIDYKLIQFMQYQTSSSNLCRLAYFLLPNHQTTKMRIKFRCGKPHHTLSRFQEQLLFLRIGKLQGISWIFISILFLYQVHMIILQNKEQKQQLEQQQ